MSNACSLAPRDPFYDGYNIPFFLWSILLSGVAGTWWDSVKSFLFSCKAFNPLILCFIWVPQKCTVFFHCALTIWHRQQGGHDREGRQSHTGETHQAGAHNHTGGRLDRNTGMTPDFKSKAARDWWDKHLNWAERNFKWVWWVAYEQ